MSPGRPQDHGRSRRRPGRSRSSRGFHSTAFITGISGEFYRQFALTIAASTIISAMVSLTLSPARGLLLSHGHDRPSGI
jgi:multidrug efflux pump subunit AcrB